MEKKTINISKGGQEKKLCKRRGVLKGKGGKRNMNRKIR
jgi:hypothetical protein